LPADRIAAATQLPITLVEDELKSYAKQNGLVAKRLEGTVVLFREGNVSGAASAGAGGLEMPFIQRVKALFTGKGDNEKKLSLLSERRAALSVQRDRAFDEMGVLEQKEAEMRQQLDEYNGTASLLYASVDDQVRNIWIYRNASPAGGFQVTVPEDNIFDSPDDGFDLPGGPYGPAVTDGWWLLVEPLAPGQHKILFKGGTGDNHLIQVTTYNITVIPEPGSLVLLSLPALLLRRTVLGQFMSSGAKSEND
jgi:hypothetical protein